MAKPRPLIDAATDGFEFLGYRFDKGRKWPRHKSIMKLRDSIRSRTPHTMDGWIRERLRNILRHQHKLPGRSGKMDHKRWPNKFFAGLGFYSLDKAHKLARQSMKMAH